MELVASEAAALQFFWLSSRLADVLTCWSSVLVSSISWQPCREPTTSTSNGFMDLTSLGLAKTTGHQPSHAKGSSDFHELTLIADPLASTQAPGTGGIRDPPVLFSAPATKQK